MKIVQYMLGIRNADGGVVRAFVDLCALLADAGHEVICMTTDDRDAPAGWDGQSRRPLLRTFKASSWFPTLLTAASLREAEAHFRDADAIHLHVPWDPICAQLAKRALRLGVPYVVTIHGMLDDWTIAQKAWKKKSYLALFGRKLLERAACVQCTSQIEMEQSAKRYPRGRSRVAPLPFDLKPFSSLPDANSAKQIWPARPGGFAALAVGRLDPIKRLEMLIDAAALLMQRGLELDVVLAGTGDDRYVRSLRELAGARGVHDRVHMPGFISGKDKLALYQSADVLVHPSAHENFGYATIESLACQRPVITTKAVNIWSELEQSGGAVLVEQSAGDLANAIADICGNQCRRAQMGQAGRAWVFEYLDPARIVGLYEQMYRPRETHR
jgi:glycosyltransferase involved in cell wall biosynthesis